jgi:hypothetical protein
LTLLLRAAKLPDFSDTHLRVADNGLQSLLTLRRSQGTSDSKTFVLYIPGSLHALANEFASLDDSVTAQSFIIHARDFDMDVGAIQQPRDELLVFRYPGRCAGAWFDRIPVLVTWIRLFRSEKG